MNWNEKCLLELTYHNMFEDDSHRQRFRDLLNCYFKASFFDKKVCKCMYLASWTEEYFLFMLGVLNEMTLSGAKNSWLMKDYAEVTLKTTDRSDREVIRLVVSFLCDTDYQIDDFAIEDPESGYMIRQSLQAAIYIDEMPAL